MSRGGRWKTDAAVSRTGIIRKRGRWQTPVKKPDEHLELAKEVEKAAATKPDQSFVEWAMCHIAGKADGTEATELIVDVSSYNLDEQAGLGMLFQRLLTDGPQEDIEWRKDIEKGVEQQYCMAWAAAEHRHRVVRCFHKLIETMVDVIEWEKDLDDERFRKGAEVFANSLARFAYRMQKRLEKRTEEKDDVDSEQRLWKSERFQAKLTELRKHKASSHPKRRFAEYVCTWGIGYHYANARLNGRELIIDGITWKFPKTDADFKAMRPLLQSVSVDRLEHYAEILEEDGLTGQAQKVRALTKSKDRHRFYHEAQFDEAFRSHFGLSKARKAKAKKAAKAPKKQARKRG